MIDPDVEPVVNALNNEMELIQQNVVVPYSNLSEEKIVTTMSIQDQVRLSLAGAYAVLSSFYCYKRVHNEPLDPIVKAKIDRVADYIRKVKNSDILRSDQVEASQPPETSERAVKSRKTARSEDAMDLALGAKRPRVNIDASIRLAEATRATNEEE